MRSNHWFARKKDGWVKCSNECLCQETREKKATPPRTSLRDLHSHYLHLFLLMLLLGVCLQDDRSANSHMVLPVPQLFLLLPFHREMTGFPRLPLLLVAECGLRYNFLLA